MQQGVPISSCEPETSPQPSAAATKESEKPTEPQEAIQQEVPSADQPVTEKAANVAPPANECNRVKASEGNAFELSFAAKQTPPQMCTRHIPAMASAGKAVDIRPKIADEASQAITHGRSAAGEGIAGHPSQQNAVFDADGIQTNAGMLETLRCTFLIL